LGRTARRAIDVARVARPGARRLGRSARRRRFVVRAKAAASWAGAELDIRIAEDADIRSVDLDIWPGTHSSLVIGAGARLGDGVRLSLRGGRLEIGAGTDVRRHGTYHVGGALLIGSGCVLSTGVCVHCAESVSIGDLTIVGEYTTIADSAHVRTAPGAPVHHSVRTRPVAIGSNVWIGAHAVVASGTDVGDQCFIGAGAVVVSDVPAGWLAGGVPAKPLRELAVEA
jgi:acetyltransferase-like isoleucine patch superfamily enzyme